LTGDIEKEDDLETASTRRASDLPLPGGDFRLFVTRLSFQAMIALGLIENPVTRTRQLNPANAKMLIDDLEMLRDKTFGNLDDEESAYLDKIVSDLRHHLTRVTPR
jgi:hypothetical protein